MQLNILSMLGGRRWATKLVVKTLREPRPGTDAPKGQAGHTTIHAEDTLCPELAAKRWLLDVLMVPKQSREDLELAAVSDMHAGGFRIAGDWGKR